MAVKLTPPPPTKDSALDRWLNLIHRLLTGSEQIDPGQIVGGAGVTDHGALTGLADDDHTIYVLADGTRDITGLQRFDRYSDVSNGGVLLRRSRGTVSAKTIVSSGDSIASVAFQGYDGSTFVTSGRIQCLIDNTPGASDMPGRLIFETTPDGSNAATERLRIDSVGFSKFTGSVGRGTVVTKTGNFTVAATENWIVCNGTGTITVTLPTASSFTGREIMIKTIAAQQVDSDSSNVAPIGSATAGTAILAATAGKWATLVSDGTNWIVMQAG